MHNSDWASFWWKNITGANMVVSEVVQALNDNVVVVLTVPDDLPWRYQMRSIIELRLRNNVLSENVLIKTIDATDECKDEDPGHFLLNKYCKDRKIRTGYRTGSGKTIQQYLINNRILHDCLIWVKGFKSGQTEKWLRFCSGYDSKGTENGVFILEIKDHRKLALSGQFPEIRFAELVSRYDVNLLNSFILDKNEKYTDDWKRYLSTLAANLCENDAEISAELLNVIDFHIDEPLEGLKRIIDSKKYDLRGGDPQSGHVLSLYRKNNEKELLNRIWESQVQILFPLIEIERVYFINKFTERIQNALTSHEITQDHQRITDPVKVEITTLRNMIKSGYMSMLEKDDRERIFALRDYRNSLAHLGRLTSQEVNNLLSDHERFLPIPESPSL